MRATAPDTAPEAGTQPPDAAGPPPAAIDWSRHALFLDFDGTLAPLRDRPEEVRLEPAVARLLDRAQAATSGAVAVISGRSMADLSGLLEGRPLAISGSHGVEMALPGEDAMADRPHGAAAQALEAAYHALNPLARHRDLLLERKPGAVALHYRNREDAAAEARAAVEAAAEGSGLRALHGNMVSEAALAGHDKGTALDLFMGRPPFHGRRPVMIGDDTTDEDGFRAAQAAGGFGLRIGGAQTCARYRVARIEHALGWLAGTLDPGTFTKNTERSAEWTWD